jgi:serine/threonine-protein kinase HipA
MNSLLKWVMFNYFIGNHKTHSKQAAFILTDEGPRLAPFMDLLSTAVYEGGVQPMAMNIGGEDRPTWVIAKRWESFAKTVKIKPKYVKTMLGTLARQIVVAADKLAEGLLENENPAGEDVIRNIVQTIKSRSRSTLNNLRAAQH